MKILSFVADGKVSFGLLVNGGIVDCGRHFADCADLWDWLQRHETDSLTRFATDAPDFAPDAVRLQPLIPNPAASFFCIGINYRPHVLEMGREVPPHPVIFVRFASSLVGHGEPLIRPRASMKFDFEGELAVVIGRPGRRIPATAALDHVAGYSCFNDGSIRDYQRHSGQFTPGKNFDRSGAFGPWLVTRDEIPDPAALRLQTRLNGQVVQSESTGELIFSIGDLIEYISSFTQLVPGDVIVTGTPGGVGAGRTPPLWMQAGDTVEVEISGLGCLSNRIADEDAD
jgi:2-keto-4-pentenoate hydratase/2-oxohepta-3-ene-1,7-dioic acid hydratase in catechol pathway